MMSEDKREAYDEILNELMNKLWLEIDYSNKRIDRIWVVMIVVSVVFMGYILVHLGTKFL